MRHGTLGHLNGYVAIPKGHNAWGENYDLINDNGIEVHGGLTYSDEDKETGEWVVGFDCSHAGDFSPKLVATLMEYTDTSIDHHMRDTYRTFAWVKEEVCSLARQLKMLNLGVKK
jgi:nanoRNase/pAp phosphatase (c-di-AMP/oligoRNAs hydrolase)